MRQDSKERHSPDVALCRGQRLESWKAIAGYLNRTVRTSQRWEKNEGLPVHRHLHEKQGSVYAYTRELDAWRAERTSSSPSEPPSAKDVVIGYIVLGALVIAPLAYWWHATTRSEDVAVDSGRPAVGHLSLISPDDRAQEWGSPEAFQQFTIGMDHLKRRNQELAIAAFQRALSLDPDATRPLGALALARALQSGQVMDRVTYTQASAAADKALQTDPALPEAHAAQGILALEEGRVADAEATLRTAIELDPELGEARYWLVVALDEQGKFAEADRELQAALVTDPLHPEINNALAIRYRASGQYEMARRRLLAMLELEAPPIHALHGLMELDTEFGRLDEALRWARQIARRKPVYDGLNALISAYARLEMNRDAEFWHARLADVEPAEEPRLGANCRYLYMRQRIEECYRLKAEYNSRSGQSIAQLPFAVQETFGGMAVLTHRYEEGISVLEPLFRPELRIPMHLGGSDMALMFAQMLAYAYQQTGRKRDAQLLLEEISEHLESLRVRNRGARPLIMVAEARNHALLGQDAQALASLREAIEAGWRNHVYDRAHPAWISLRDHDDYRELLAFVDEDVARQRRGLQSRGSDSEFEATVLEAIRQARRAETGSRLSSH